jgi:chromosome segregation ATPase
VALVKIWRDAIKRDEDMSAFNAATERLNSDLKDLEEENDELKAGMAEKFVDGFRAALEQVKVLFPDIDGEVLAQADFLKKVDDGKLVSRLPA